MLNFWSRATLPIAAALLVLSPLVGGDRSSRWRWPSGPPKEKGSAHPAPACRWKEVEYGGSTRINTCVNAASVIYIRVMSLGPGACAVEIYDAGVRPIRNRRGLTALPGVWTGWTELLTHYGQTTAVVTNDVKCDTGVRSQVRYSANE
jgi:hypothetical protein